MLYLNTYLREQSLQYDLSKDTHCVGVDIQNSEEHSIFNDEILNYKSYCLINYLYNLEKLTFDDKIKKCLGDKTFSYKILLNEFKQGGSDATNHPIDIYNNLIYEQGVPVLEVDLTLANPDKIDTLTIKKACSNCALILDILFVYENDEETILYSSVKINRNSEILTNFSQNKKPLCIIIDPSNKSYLLQVYDNSTLTNIIDNKVFI